jgi:hypothetical protein
LELVDDRFEKLAEELRASRPAAPEALRERVRALAPPPPPRFELNLRRLAPAVALGGLAAALGVAVVLGVVHGSSLPQATKQARRAPATVEQTLQGQKGSRRSTLLSKGFRADASKGFPAPSANRLQRYDAFMRVRVHDQDELSQHTQDALRLTRKLGGYLVWARYAAPRRSGDSELVLRIPVENVQEALTGFSGYGTLVRQRIVLKDLQQRVDSLTARIGRLRREIARIKQRLAGPLTPEQRAVLEQRLREDRRQVAALTAQKSSAVRRGQLAQVALTMVFGSEPAAAHGRFRRTIDDALSVLARELEILLYAALVAGPLLAVGGAGILAGRSLRRRADRRLLERT